MTTPIDTYMQPAPFFGACPACGSSGHYLNIGNRHYFYCSTHRVCWPGGMNLFSTWRDEGPREWTANAAYLQSCTIIVPAPLETGPKEVVRAYWPARRYRDPRQLELQLDHG